MGYTDVDGERSFVFFCFLIFNLLTRIIADLKFYLCYVYLRLLSAVILYWSRAVNLSRT